MTTEDLQAKVEREVWDRLQRCGQIVQDRMVQTLSIPGEPREGDAPHRVTGELAASIHVNENESLLRVEVGSNLFKAQVLERGTRTRPPHPFARRSLIESMPAIRREFGG